MDNLVVVFKALSDETRLRIMVLLYKRDHCVCELTEILALSQPKISKHLAKLKDLGLIESRRKQLYIYYHINKEYTFLSYILQYIDQALDTYPQLYQDHKALSQCTLIETKADDKG